MNFKSIFLFSALISQPILGASWQDNFCTKDQIQKEVDALKAYANTAAANLASRPASEGGVLICSGGANGSYTNNVCYDAAQRIVGMLDWAGGLSGSDYLLSCEVRRANCGSIAPAMINELLKLVKPCCVRLYVIASNNDHNAVAVTPINGDTSDPGKNALLIIDAWWCEKTPTVFSPATPAPGVETSVGNHFSNGSALQTYDSLNKYYEGLTENSCKPNTVIDNPNDKPRCDLTVECSDCPTFTRDTRPPQEVVPGIVPRQQCLSCSGDVINAIGSQVCSQARCKGVKEVRGCKVVE